MKAVWNDTVVAESDETIVVENNQYFPPASVKSEHLRKSGKQTVCGWKGTASYYDIVVGDAVNPNAAWVYPQTKEKAKSIEGYIAFWNGVQIVE